MTNLSKLTFTRCVSKETPCTIFHPWSSNCVDGIAIFTCNLLFGCSKFFLPIYVVKLMLNWRRVNKKYLLTQMFAYLRTVGYGVTFGTLFLVSCCLTSRVNVYYFILMQAGAIGGLSLLLESEENKHIDKILFFNQVIETLLNSLTAIKYIKRTRLNETISFMFITSILMYLFKTRTSKQKLTHLWFYPEKSLYSTKTPYNSHSVTGEGCTHKKSCFEHCHEGGYNYFLIGYLLEIVRRFLPKMFDYIKYPSRILKLLVNKNNVLMGMFLGGYVALYRYITCYFQRSERKEMPSHAFIAAFVASTTYFFRPNLQILIIAFTTMLQLLWERITTTLTLPKSIPYSQMLFCVSSGILLHYRFLLPDHCPKYVLNMVDIATNNLSTKLYKLFMSNLKETEKYVLSLNSV